MKIVVATDGTAYGEAAVAALAAFSLKQGDVVKIVCVVDMAIPIGIDVYGGYLPDTSALESAARDNAQRVLDLAVASANALLKGTDALVSGEILFGSPDNRIVEAAEQLGADLIIVGSHGYNRWERLLLGSVSDSVVHHAPCSVLVVRTPKGRDRN
ncbi:MAG: universal stress protein [Pyrinomonadaceae bacterium]